MAKRRRRSRKWLKRLLILLLVIVAGVVCYLVWDAYFKEENMPAPEAPETPIVEDVEVDEGYGEVVKEEAVVEKEEVKQYEGENPNSGGGLTGVVNYAAVVDGTLRVRVNIDQFVTGGTCELSLIQNGQSIYNTVVPMADAASTATCQGFDVSVAGFASGKTKIVINLSAAGKTGVINGEVEI